MSARLDKVLTLLNSATSEGEAMAAWRAARRFKPDGPLFEPGTTGQSSTRLSAVQQVYIKRKVSEAYERGLEAGAASALAGFKKGVRRAAFALFFKVLFISWFLIEFVDLFFY